MTFLNPQPLPLGMTTAELRSHIRDCSKEIERLRDIGHAAKQFIGYEERRSGPQGFWYDKLSALLSPNRNTGGKNG